jgi:hypothetical protein
MAGSDIVGHFSLLWVSWDLGILSVVSVCSKWTTCTAWSTRLKTLFVAY